LLCSGGLNFVLQCLRNCWVKHLSGCRRCECFFVDVIFVLL
jgi:hypothetical protein